MSPFLAIVLKLCLAALLASGLMCLYRMFIGPKAADRAADRALAKNYYEKLVSLAGNADTSRPDLVAAKQYLASR